jgi:hypothetical protein
VTVPERMTAAEFRRFHRAMGSKAVLDAHAKRPVDPTAPKARKWSNAKRTVCAMGHTHDSKLEARVCDRLAAIPQPLGTMVLRGVRYPLLSSCRAFDRPTYMTIDFSVYTLGNGTGWHLTRLIDAKGRTSREWTRGKAALEASVGVKVEEVRA